MTGTLIMGNETVLSLPQRRAVTWYAARIQTAGVA